MRGSAVVVLLGIILWLFAKGAAPFTFIPGIGVYYLIMGDRRGAGTDQVFVAGWAAVLILIAAAALKRFLGLL